MDHMSQGNLALNNFTPFEDLTNRSQIPGASKMSNVYESLKPTKHEEVKKPQRAEKQEDSNENRVNE